MSGSDCVVSDRVSVPTSRGVLLPVRALLQLGGRRKGLRRACGRWSAVGGTGACKETSSAKSRHTASPTQSRVAREALPCARASLSRSTASGSSHARRASTPPRYARASATASAPHSVSTRRNALSNELL